MVALALLLELPLRIRRYRHVSARIIPRNVQVPGEAIEV
jgi:hypothetical protein